MSGIFSSFILFLSLLQFLIIFLDTDPRCLLASAFDEGFQHLQYGSFFCFVELKDILKKLLFNCFCHKKSIPTNLLNSGRKAKSYELR